jgi:mannosylfructose-6-phosphate phosphatase
MRREYLVISDIDGTLLGDSEALQSLNDWIEAGTHQLLWVFSSGRFFQSVCRSVREEKMPAPRAIIGGVGTEILKFPGGDPMVQWCKHIDPGGTRFSESVIKQEFSRFQRLVFQPLEFQSPFKVSFYLHDARAEELAELARCLTRAGMDFQLVYSSKRDLDVLPSRANKGNAARFLAEEWKFAPDRVIVAGDSANDRAMFDVGFRGIVVGNAATELKALDSGHVFQATDPFAAGVLQGLKYWLEQDETSSRRQTFDNATHSI